MSIARLVELTTPAKCAPAAQATTNAYVKVAGSDLDARYASRICYHLNNSGANSLKWKVMAGVDGTNFPKEAQAEATVIAGSDGTFDASALLAAYPYFAVYVKSAVNDTPGEATIHGFAKP